MKKIILSLLLLTAISQSFAQKWYFGPQAGIGCTSVSRYDLNERFGFQAGIFGGYEIDKLVGIELQVNYSSQGGAMRTYDSYRGFVDHKMCLSYINVPVLVKFDIAKGITGYSGPQTGFCVGAKYKIDNVSTDMMNDMNKVDLGWMFGIGYQFNFGLRLMADYTLGLTNATKQGGKNRVFCVKAAWRF